MSLLDPTGSSSEQYRVAPTPDGALHRTAGPRSSWISSPGDGDGKTTTAINLAGALGQAPDARVLLIDADLRRSAMAGRLGLPDDGCPAWSISSGRRMRFADVARPLAA